MASTPAGKEGYFYKRFKEAFEEQKPDARFKVFYKTTVDVVNERPISNEWTEEIRQGALRQIEEARKEMTELQFGQEYLGKFLDDLRMFFDEETINKCCVLKRQQTARENIFMGVDIARLGGDETTYEFIKKNGDESYIHVESIVRQGQFTTKTQQEIKDLTLSWNAKRVGIDAGSGALGVGVYDNLMDDNIMKRRLEAMNNRTISTTRDGKGRQRIFKEDLYFNLKSMMEKRWLYLLDDDNIKLSLRSIQIEWQPDGSAKIFGSYSHIVEGLIRAAWLARKEKINKLMITWF